jgi:ElaB/YqjD/DUF883 family membrane-anchored ribosome-binding protein
VGRATSVTRTGRANFVSLWDDLLVWAVAERANRADSCREKLTGELPMAEEDKSHQRASGVPDAQQKLESSKTHARKAAEDLKSAAGAVAHEYRGKAEQAWDEARDKAEDAWGEATERARTFQQDAEQYVRENPTKAVVTALGIGFVLGMIFRR